MYRRKKKYMRNLFAIIGVIALVMALTSITPTKATTNFVLPTMIAFGSSGRDGGTGYEIWIVDPNNPSDIRQVTDNSYNNEYPIWSPDGLKIAYRAYDTSNGVTSIWVINADGTNPTQISPWWSRGTGDMRATSWNRDGTRVYYYKAPSGGPCYFLWAEYDQSPDMQEHPVIGAETKCDGVISPNEMKVAFRTYGSHDIEIGDLINDGTSVTNIFTLPIDIGYPKYMYNWSPFSESIAFGVDFGNWRANIYTISTNGTNLVQISHNDNSSEYTIDPDWSPDGQWIASTRNWDLLIYKSDGTGDPIYITQDEYVDNMPDWSPVLNYAPIVSSITAPIDPIPVYMEFVTYAEFSDQDIHDTHDGLWEWGDSSSSSGIIDEANGFGTVTGNHVYTEPGVYTLKLKVNDSYGYYGESIYKYIVVYDPDGGFVTGGGWIDSPAGAYITDPTLYGKANFGFVSKYKKGATVPTGQTEFQFHTGDLNFHSSSYEWLVVTGSEYARFKGSGTNNGQLAPNGEPYKFMIWAGDGTGSEGTDTFRINIWYEVDSTEIVIYDNGMDQSIGGGNIVVHSR